MAKTMLDVAVNATNALSKVSAKASVALKEQTEKKIAAIVALDGWIDSVKAVGVPIQSIEEELRKLVAPLIEGVRREQEEIQKKLEAIALVLPSGNSTDSATVAFQALLSSIVAESPKS